MPVDEFECEIANRLAHLLRRGDGGREVHAAQTRLVPHTSSNPVSVAQGPRVMSVAGVTPGSMTDDLAGTFTDQPNASEPTYLRLA